MINSLSILSLKSVSIFFIFGIVFALMMHVTAVDAERPSFKRTFGSEGIANSEFQSPVGIAIDSEGNVWVTDHANATVQKFTANGTFLMSFGTSCNLTDAQGCVDPDGSGPLQIGDGQFYNPAGIAIDSNGNVYVADQGNGRVQKFSSDSRFLAILGNSSTASVLDRPYDLAIDSNGNVYVTDMGNSRILKFSSNGTYLTEIKREDQSPDTIEIPIGIATDSKDNIYVSIGDNYHIEKFSSDGSFMTAFGSPGGCRAEFGASYGIATDAGDNVYVVDQTRHRIQEFSSNGTFLSVFGLEERTKGDQLSYPSDVAINEEDGGSIYVTDTRNHRVVIFSQSEELVKRNETLSYSSEMYLQIDEHSYTTIPVKSTNVYPICGKLAPDNQSIKVEFDVLSPLNATLELTIPRDLADDIQAVQTSDAESIEFEQHIDETSNSTIVTFSPSEEMNSVEIRAAKVIPDFPFQC